MFRAVLVLKSAQLSPRALENVPEIRIVSLLNAIYVWPLESGSFPDQVLQL